MVINKFIKRKFLDNYPIMKKTYIFSNKEDIKRSSTVTKQMQASKVLLPIYETFKYYVGMGNNAHLIRKIMSTRKNWQEIQQSKNVLLSFKWQQSNKGYNYQNCSNKKVFKQVLNHFEYHTQLSNKEFMFKNFLEFCEVNKFNAFQYVPITFIVNTMDNNYENQQTSFLNFYHENNPKKVEKIEKSQSKPLNIKRKSMNMGNSLTAQKKIVAVTSKYEIRQVYTTENTKYLWILKPTFYNRGNGVHVFNSLYQLQGIMNKYIAGSSPSTVSIDQNKETSPLKKATKVLLSHTSFIIISTSFVIQKYMERPLLLNGRKFDIRVWVLVSHEFKLYLFKEGYMRTSSCAFEINEEKISDLRVHLTNNAVQKNTSDYNKFETGNQLSFKYLKQLIEQKGKPFTVFMTEMKKIIEMSALSVKRKLNRYERDNCFQIFGYDFMVDDKQCKPWLIEVNTNPCIEQSSPILEQLLPRMIDDAFTLTLDKIFQTAKTNYTYVVDNYQNSENLWQLLVDLKKI